MRRANSAEGVLKVTALAILVWFISIPSGSSAQPSAGIILEAGEELSISCSDDSRPLAYPETASSLAILCGAIHVSPTSTPTPVASATIGPTVTVSPSVIPTVIAPEIGEECPAWLHDSHVAIGDDGKSYPTWHPHIDQTYGCYYSHEHGDEPVTASMTASPPFGYIASVAKINEPHAGFKVYTLECGEQGDNGASQIEAIAWQHMGTSGVGRYRNPFHSLHLIIRSCDGSWQANVQGLADYGVGTEIGSVCDSERKGGRDFSTIGCVEAGSPELAYEIWNPGVLSIIDPDDPYTGLFQQLGYFVFIPASFDPVTTVNPNDLDEVVYTVDIVFPGMYDPFGSDSPFVGKKREAYFGPNSIINSGGESQYTTDVYGNIVPPGTEGSLIQYISTVNIVGSDSNASENGSQFKKIYDYGGLENISVPN